MSSTVSGNLVNHPALRDILAKPTKMERCDWTGLLSRGPCVRENGHHGHHRDRFGNNYTG